jgi:hypothetical protein
MGDGSHVFFDTCSPAAILSNSEVGFGRLSIDHGVWTKVCTNMAVIAKAGMKHTHLGARHEASENLEAMLTDDTKRITAAAVMLQARDVLKAAFDEMRFSQVTEVMGKLAKIEVTKPAQDVVELIGKKIGATEVERASILQHLIKGGDLTAYGVFNALTRTAEDAPQYDRASQLEKAGGDLLELPATEWRELALAA